jgi:hypothetical protein
MYLFEGIFPLKGLDCNFENAGTLLEKYFAKVAKTSH